jgi:hypothetical protein
MVKTKSSKLVRMIRSQKMMVAVVAVDVVNEDNNSDTWLNHNREMLFLQ